MKLRMKSAVAGVTALALACAGLAFAAQANAYTGSGPRRGAPVWVAGGHTAQGRRAVLRRLRQPAHRRLKHQLPQRRLRGDERHCAAIRSHEGDGVRRSARPGPNPRPRWAFQNMTPNFTLVAFPGPYASPPPNAPGAFVKLTAAGPRSRTWSRASLCTAVRTPTTSTCSRSACRTPAPASPPTAASTATDIEFNPTSATAPYDGLAPGAWRVVWPATVGGTTTTTVSTNPASGSATTATPVTLTATVSPATAAGTVQFQVDGANVGGAIAVAGGTASFNAGLLGASAGHTVRADFTPATRRAPSASRAASAPRRCPSPRSRPAPPPRSAARPRPRLEFLGHLHRVGHGRLRGAVGHGSVQFTVNGTNVGSPVPYAGGAVSFAYQPTAAVFVAISAVFSGDAAFGNSTGNVVAVTVSAPAYTPDPQNVTVVVPQGTLVISTPYTVANPLSPHHGQRGRDAVQRERAVRRPVRRRHGRPRPDHRHREPPASRRSSPTNSPSPTPAPTARAGPRR